MIVFEQLSKRYQGGAEALSSINLSIQRGEMAFLTGHSGAGKSTLLKMILGLERPSSGNLQVNGQWVNRLKEVDLAHYRRQLGMVYQNHQLLLDRSALHNVCLPLQIAGVHPKEAEKRGRSALDRVGLLDKANFSPVQLSGGEQQRVGIARAIINNPRIILADEPTGNLDPKLSREIMALFVELNRDGTTVLVASHDIYMIARMPYRVVTLRHGHVVKSGESRHAQ